MLDLDKITYEDFLKLQKKFINGKDIEKKEEKKSYPFGKMRYKKLKSLVDIDNTWMMQIQLMQQLLQ